MSRGIITRLVVSLVVWLAVSLNLSGQQRRVQVRPMAIKDAKGQQVGLYQASYALVIGVSNYTAGWPDLPSVVGESQQVAQALEENGFQVQRVLDPDYDQLKQSLEQFIDQYGYEGENRLLIFFSGHGHSSVGAAPHHGGDLQSGAAVYQCRGGGARSTSQKCVYAAIY